MDNNIEVFSNPEFGSLTTITIEGAPWFIGKEVAEKLGYTDYKQALKKHTDNTDRMIVSKSEISKGVDSTLLENIPNRGLSCINESGLYSLILSSKLPTAKKFKHWVTSEVLPAIRKHGAYLTPETIEQVLYNPDTIIKIATQLKEEREKNKKLSATNAALVKETNTWDGKKVITALVRAFGSKRMNGNFSYAFNTFYKKLNYGMNINLKSRKTRSTKPKAALIDFLTEKEIPSAIQIAVAMCEESGIETGTIISETNMKKFSA